MKTRQILFSVLFLILLPALSSASAAQITADGNSATADQDHIAAQVYPTGRSSYQYNAQYTYDEEAPYSSGDYAYDSYTYNYNDPFGYYPYDEDYDPYFYDPDFIYDEYPGSGYESGQNYSYSQNNPYGITWDEQNQTQYPYGVQQHSRDELKTPDYHFEKKYPETYKNYPKQQNIPQNLPYPFNRNRQQIEIYNYPQQNYDRNYSYPYFYPVPECYNVPNCREQYPQYQNCPNQNCQNQYWQNQNVYVEKRWNANGSLSLTWTIRNLTNEDWWYKNVDIRCISGYQLLLDPCRTLWDLPYTVYRGGTLTFTVNIWQPLYNETMSFSIVAGSKTLYTFMVDPNL